MHVSTKPLQGRCVGHEGHKVKKNELNMAAMGLLILDISVDSARVHVVRNPLSWVSSTSTRCEKDDAPSGGPGPPQAASSENEIGSYLSDYVLHL